MGHDIMNVREFLSVGLSSDVGRALATWARVVLQAS